VPSPSPSARFIIAVGSGKGSVLGAIPLYPLVSQSGGRAQPLLIAQPQLPQAAALRHIARQLVAKLEASSG